MSAMRERARHIDPEIAFWSEGVNDILGQSFDGLQAGLGFDALLAGLGEWDPRIFKCTFPEFVLVTGDLSGETGRNALAWAIITGGHYHFFVPDPRQLDPTSRRWIRFAAKVRSRYWQAFTSTDVSAPEVDGDAGVRVLRYVHGKRTLIVGAPLARAAKVDREFQATLRVPDAARIIRSDWLFDADSARTRLRGDRLTVAGRGPFAVSMGV
jgi:hypothetical protein